MKKVMLALAALILSSHGGLSMEPVYLFLEKDGSAGQIHHLTLEDMKLHPNQSFWYTESYFFIAYLDSGEIAYLNLIISNMGLKKNQPAMTLTIITPERKRLTTEKDFAPEDLKLAPDHFELKIGENLLAGTDRELSLRVSQATLALELDFKSPTPGFKLGEGTVYFGAKKDSFYSINYPAPRSRVSGSISYDGKKVQAKGWGYVDHCWYNSNTTDFEEIWHNLKLFSDQTTLILTSFTTPEKYANQLVGIAALVDDSKVLFATTDLKVSESDHDFDTAAQKKYPRRILYEFSCPGYRGRIDFNSSRVVEKMDVLEKLDKGAAKALKWTINKFVAKPFYYRSFGPAELVLEQKSATSRIQGKASCEVIFIK